MNGRNIVLTDTIFMTIMLSDIHTEKIINFISTQMIMIWFRNIIGELIAMEMS